jgi:uncharacterized integral membrane protein (TIGR00698 family)
VLLAEAPFFKQTLRFSPLLVVILLGMVLASVVRLPTVFEPGIKVAQRPLLRWAVAGLGFRLSLPELVAIGGPSLAVIVVSTVAALAFGWWLGVWLGLDERLAVLLGVGTSVCGASAVVAADSVVQAKGESAAVSLGVITLWGTVGIFAYPWIGHALAMGDFPYGVWTGATLHEMAQVVAGAQAFSPDATDSATVVKLARICLLAPIVFFLAWWFRRRGTTGEAQVQAVPWFLVMFVVFAGVNSAAPSLGIEKSAIDMVVRWVLFLLAVGMAGVGLKSSFSVVRSAGWKPVVVGLGQWLFLALLAYGLTVALVPAAPR